LLYWLARFLGDYLKSIYVGLGFKGAVLGG
jgi:hypothetical protein